MIDSPEEKEAREESMAALLEGRINIAMSRHTDRWKPVFCEKMAIEIIASQERVARAKDDEWKRFLKDAVDDTERCFSIDRYPNLRNKLLIKLELGRGEEKTEAG